MQMNFSLTALEAVATNCLFTLKNCFFRLRNCLFWLRNCLFRLRNCLFWLRNCLFRLRNCLFRLINCLFMLKTAFSGSETAFSGSETKEAFNLRGGVSGVCADQAKLFSLMKSMLMCSNNDNSLSSSLRLTRPLQGTVYEAVVVKRLLCQRKLLSESLLRAHFVHQRQHAWNEVGTRITQPTSLTARDFNILFIRILLHWVFVNHRSKIRCLNSIYWFKPVCRVFNLDMRTWFWPLGSKGLTREFVSFIKQNI